MSLDYLPHYQWAIVMGILSVLWGWSWVRPRFGVMAASLLSYLILSSLWVWVWVENRYVTINPYDQMALRYFSVDSLARMMIILVPLMVSVKNRDFFFMMGKAAVTSFVIANSLWILAGLLTSGCREANSCGGAGNPSIMVGAMVCMLPVALTCWKSQWWVGVLATAAVLVSKSSIALGLLGIYFAYVTIASKRYKLAAVLSPAPLIAGYFILGKTQLFLSSSRFMIWEYMMNLWAAPKNILFGVGFGTYHVFSIHLQQLKSVHSGYHWNSMHNDFLEMLFVGGSIGAALFAATYLCAFWKMAMSREGAAMSILLYGIYMGVNPALHHAIPALFGAWLFIYALSEPINLKETAHA